MELCDVTVRLGGSVQHTVPKSEVTPAEILLLKHIHGGDSVIDIRPAGKDKRQHAAEWDRLSRLYDGAADANAPGQAKVSLMERLFGGAAIRKLPATLKDIGLAGVVSAAPAKQIVAEPADDEDGDDGNGEDDA